MPSHIPRYFVAPGAVVPTDEDGLPRVDDDLRRAFGVATWEELASVRCLVLLGEPGSGKSMELRRAGANQTLRMGSYDTGQFLRSDLREMLRCPDGVPNLVLHIDGLDESVISTVSGILGDEFERAAADPRVRVRLSCRTGAWPDALGSRLREAFGDENFSIRCLLPFTRDQVIAYVGGVESPRVDAKELLVAVREARAGPLAGRPLTLKFLVDTFATGDALPPSRWELYELAMLHACAEQNSQRPRRASGWDAERRLRLLEGIAVGLLLGCRGPFRLTERATSDSALHLEDLASADAGSRVLVPGDLEALRLALLDESVLPLEAPSEHVRSFAHRTVLEFLTARWILRNSKGDPGAIWNVLTRGRDVVHPDLYELAGWLATRCLPLVDRLLKADPSVLVLGDAALLEEADRARAVEALLQACAGYTLADGGLGGWPDQLGRLAHAGLPEQLLPWLRPGGDFVATRVAIRFVEECHPHRKLFEAGKSPASLAKWEPVHDALAALVRDPAVPHEHRAPAAWALAWTAGRERWDGLRDLLDGEIDGDEHRTRYEITSTYRSG